MVVEHPPLSRMSSRPMAVDETHAGARVQPRPHQKGFFLAIASNDRPWDSADPPAVAYSDALWAWL